MCNACLPTPSTTAAEAFAGELLETLNRGALALMISIGHRTGLFDALSDLPPADCDTIAAHAGLDNVTLEGRDLSDFGVTAEQDAFQLITAFDAIHDQAAPQSVLNGVYRSLSPGGSFLMQDIRASSHLENNLGHPIAPLLYTLSTMHCMTVSLAQGGAGLGTMWGEELATDMLQQAGFDEVRVERLAHDFQNNFYVARKVPGTVEAH